MLQDYVKVIQYIKQLDNCVLNIYGKRLCFLDYQGFSSCLDRVISDYRKVFTVNSEIVFDIDVTRPIDAMIQDDILNFLLCVKPSQYGDFVLLRYSEIGCWNNPWMKNATFDAYEGLLREMRSIVVDIKSYKVVSLPFYKFMNMNQSPEYSESEVMNRLIRANVVEYADKLDGSFIQITALDKQYTFYPYIDLLTTSKNLKDTIIVNEARKWYEEHPYYKYLVQSYKDYTLLFEWISMNDKHVVNYLESDCGLWLIGMRHKVTGELVNYRTVINIADQYGVKHTNIISGNFDDIKNSLYNFKSNEKEGYVINIDGFLVKLKCQDYLNMVACIKEKASPNVVIESIYNNSLDELLLQLPDEYKERIMAWANRVYYYLELLYNYTDTSLDYLISQKWEVKKCCQWIDKLPKLLRGIVMKKYMCYIKGIDYVDTSLKVAGLQDSNCINMIEIERRITKLEKIDLNNYLV